MFLKYNLPAFIWAFCIYILSMMPGKYIPPVDFWDLANPDKIGHLAVFGLLIVLLMYGFTKQFSYAKLKTHPALIASVACVSYGFAIEVMQGTLSVDRRFDLYDAIANAAGCLLGIILFKTLLERKLKRATAQ